MLTDPEEAFKLLVLMDEAFMGRYGEQLALATWGIHEGRTPAVNRETFLEQPLSALAYTAYQNPAQLQRFGQQLGATVGAMARGFESGWTTSPTSGDPTQECESESTHGRDRQPVPEPCDAVTLTLKGLGTDASSSTDSP